MNYRGAVLIAMIVVACLHDSLAQLHTDVDHFSEQDGLSYRWVLDITQDSRGFIWFATYDGLNRFDGAEFTVYKYSESDTNSISSNQVHHVVEDSNRVMWTYGIDLIFNRIDLVSGTVSQTNTYLKGDSLFQGPLGNNLIHFAPLTNGDFVVLFQEQGTAPEWCSFWRYVSEQNAFKHLVSVPTHQSKVRAFHEHSNGKVWLSGIGNGYYLVDLDDADYEFFQVDNLAPVAKKIGLPIDREDYIWYPLRDKFGGTNSEAASLQKVKLPESLSPENIRRVRNDNKGGVWVNTDSAELYRIHPSARAVEQYRDEVFGRSSDYRSMQRIFVDNEEAGWVGHFFGASRFIGRSQLFENYLSIESGQYEPGAEAFSAREIVELTRDQLIVSDHNSNLFVVGIKENSIQRLNRTPASMDSENTPSTIQSLLVGKNGALWSNQGGKLVRTDLTTGEFEAFQGPEHYAQERSRIFEDDQGHLWWCNIRDLFIFDRVQKRMDKIAVDIPVQSVSADFSYASYDKKTDKIYGTYTNGVYAVDCKTRAIDLVRIFDDNEGHYVVTAILNWNNEFWLSTNYGLVRYNVKTRQRRIYTRNDGLPSDIVYAALGASNVIWASTHNGLCQIDLVTGQVTAYYREHGIPNNEFNRWSYLKTKGGDMYFGGLNGIIGFDPGDFNVRPEHSGHLNLMAARKYDQKADSLLDIQVGPYSTTDKIILGPHERTISFKYILTLFEDVAKNHYSHYMEGLESGWLENGNSNEARYIQIPPGHYTFKVKARGPTKAPALNEIAIPVYVRQYWFLRWETMVGYVAIGLLFVAFFYRYQMGRRLDRQEAKRLKELDQVKARMYTNITHEFRTPLTVMLGMNRAMKGYATAGKIDKVSHASDMIDRNAKSLLELVNQMLDLSKLESGMLQINNEQGDILAYLKYRLEAFQALANEKNIRLQFSSREEELIMDFDPERISYIMNNLVSNALKFTEPGGEIVVSANLVLTREDDEWLELVVKDNGVGIEENELNHIFDRFYQVEGASMRRGEGTGIGLALVSELVKLLNGSINVFSKLGTGTEFNVMLPRRTTISDLARNDTVEITPVSNSNESVEFEEGSETNRLPLVLVVEDNADVRHYVEISIESAYRVTTAVDGRAGIEKAIEIIPDLIISDVMMPVMDGYQLCETIKTDERTSHIPVILLTAKSDHSSKVEGLEHGADAYLAKPFDPRELLIRLRNLLALRSEFQKRYAQLQGLTGDNDRVNAEDAFIMKLRAVILEHLQDDEFGVIELCKLVHVSRAQLHRKLIAITGKSASRLIRQVQLERAVELLGIGALTISEVAYQSGFKTQSHFSRVFRNAFGVSPREYSVKS